MEADQDTFLNVQIHRFYSAENPISTFAESVFVRPGMYTINGTLEEVGASLEGFYVGMSSHNHHPAAQVEAQRWFDFCVWAAEHVRGAKSGGWYNLFSALRQTCSRDNVAFLQLVELYVAFRQLQEGEDNSHVALAQAD